MSSPLFPATPPHLLSFRAKQADFFLAHSFLRMRRPADVRTAASPSAGREENLSSLRFQNRSRTEAARRSKEPPKVNVWLSPNYPGSLNIAVSSYNLVPFRYRYTLNSEGPTPLCASPNEPQEIYPTGPPLLIVCKFAIQAVQNSLIELRFEIMPIHPGGDPNAIHVEHITRKYRMREDLISLEPIA